MSKYMFRGDKQYGRSLINKLCSLSGGTNPFNYSGENEHAIYYVSKDIVQMCNCYEDLLKEGYEFIDV